MCAHVVLPKIPHTRTPAMSPDRGQRPARADGGRSSRLCGLHATAKRGAWASIAPEGTSWAVLGPRLSAWTFYPIG
ncbi:hypothetical protein KL930_004011 [Ogataea haglerorum]|nr:hypothetical protein KL915_004284 [Ogataea haglerorum]KAG7742575.1 hypothetical protein KL923_000190 [Ogataea haglerorum]KAG7773662.1 hypothetical protein KL922_005173 [Ogataea haglerorum]KAG7774181.1 hypothetical protein KL930_004011 [Ogataea haglerorum]KAG7815109.1 hypothetical protein KL924_000195 [Ogataea haglerorum]